MSLSLPFGLIISSWVLASLVVGYTSETDKDGKFERGERHLKSVEARSFSIRVMEVSIQVL